jgi:curved DNA-binding protein CbpA
MTDYFALLSESRRPWLDVDLLKQKFLTLSATAHPDKIHSASDVEKSIATKKFAELNTAYNCLTDSKLRLLHLLELESGAKPKEIQQIPAALADLFAEIAGICKNVDALLAEKCGNISPLLGVQLFERAQEWIERLNSLQKKLGDLRERLNNELKSADEAWMKADTKERLDILPKLEEFYRLFGYFNRWSNQIQERTVQLSL